MDRMKVFGLVLAVTVAVIVMDKLYLHLIRWSVVGGWFISLGRAIQG